MAQLSRPYQIGLAAVAVLAAAWLLLLRGHGETSPSSSASSAPAVVHTATSASTGKAGQATGGGSASSLGAYGHAIEKARGAVSTSQQNAKQLEEHSNQASSTSAPSASSTHTTTSAPATSPSASPSKAATKPSAPAAPAHPKSTASTPTRQHAVEAQLAQGKVAVILFWDRSGADDRLVHAALSSLRGNRSLAIDEAVPGEVAAFGSITRGVQVYGTPTMLIVNSKGKARTLTGLQDPFAIAQAVAEARRS